jgi:hypothetical protein
MQTSGDCRSRRAVRGPSASHRPARERLGASVSYLRSAKIRENPRLVTQCLKTRENPRLVTQSAKTRVHPRLVIKWARIRVSSPRL